MSDIKVGINPESEHFGGYNQLPQYVKDTVDYIRTTGWVEVSWRGGSNSYEMNDLLTREDKLFKVYKVGQNVSPKEVDGEILTGCGVIISVEEIKYNVIYKVLTDFGNVVTLMEGEFYKQYEVNSGDVIDIEERIQIQMDKLTNVWVKLKEGDYNGQ